MQEFVELQQSPSYLYKLVLLQNNLCYYHLTNNLISVVLRGRDFRVELVGEGFGDEFEFADEVRGLAFQVGLQVSEFAHELESEEIVTVRSLDEVVVVAVGFEEPADNVGSHRRFVRVDSECWVDSEPTVVRF